MGMKGIIMQKKYGVWGLGVVGKSVLQFLRKNGIKQLCVMDKRSPNSEEEIFLKKVGVEFIDQGEQERFFNENDYIIPSPGIDIGKMINKEKLIEEADLFYDAWKKSVIGVTGTLGKTSIVHMLGQILRKNGLNIQTGGNIGTGMLDLVDEDAESALLELSSFQLERTKRFAPDIAVITNIYPNHLDRHGTLQAYIATKLCILEHQRDGQQALLPWGLSRKYISILNDPYVFSRVKERWVSWANAIFYI